MVTALRSNRAACRAAQQTDGGHFLPKCPRIAAYLYALRHGACAPAISHRLLTQEERRKLNDAFQSAKAPLFIDDTAVST
jgi:hypothetical protein